MAYFNPEQNESNLQANLDLLKEIREDSNIKIVAKQRQIAQYYNKWVKIRTFEEGDLVVRNCLASRPVGE